MKWKARHIAFLILLILFSSIGSFSFAQQESNTIFKAPNLFESDTLIEMTITTDLKSLVRDIGEKNKYHKGRLSYYQGDSIVSMIVEMRTRGNFRKDRSICPFPP
ncbi:MAG: hypothetical protein N4A59_13650, partial [Marinifilum sp.]|nr:hypothetical protein [Marinifilum sp.]